MLPFSAGPRLGGGEQHGQGNAICSWSPIISISFNCMESSMSFVIYLIGFAILIGGVSWGLIVAGVPPLYVIIAAVIFLGIGILSGVALTRGKDVS
jgi:membrane-bound acyltransferase YfiQ involved in biofilm formation